MRKGIAKTILIYSIINFIVYSLAVIISTSYFLSSEIEITVKNRLIITSVIAFSLTFLNFFILRIKSSKDLKKVENNRKRIYTGVKISILSAILIYTLFPILSSFWSGSSFSIEYLLHIYKLTYISPLKISSILFIEYIVTNLIFFNKKDTNNDSLDSDILDE